MNAEAFINSGKLESLLTWKNKRRGWDFMDSAISGNSEERLF